MKYSLAFASLMSAGALLLSCGSEDTDPPPIAAGGTGSPAAAAGGAGPTGGGAGATNTTGGSGTSPNEGQAGAGAFDPGTGGAPPSGNAGAPAANAGASGANTGGAGGAAPTDLTLETLVGGMDGHLFVVPCGDTPNTDDCNGAGWTSTFQDPGMNHVCVGNPPRLDARIDFPVEGEPGAVYDVAMHFYGVMEPRQYANITRDAAPNAPGRGERDNPPPFATLNAGATNYLAGDNNYNTYELHVLDEAGQEVAAYFLNADVTDGHYTFAINYGKTIQLIGGGTLRLQIADANCRQIKNCGPNQGVPCTPKARRIDISAAVPQPAANALDQPALGNSPEHAGQWFLLDVLSFAVASTP